MILRRGSSDAFLVDIRPEVLEWTINMRNDMIHNDSFFNATDVPQADTDDTRTRRSLSFNGDRPISLGYTSSTESEALRAPRHYSMVEYMITLGLWEWSCLLCQVTLGHAKFVVSTPSTYHF
jgi:hypothetical protein